MSKVAVLNVEGSKIEDIELNENIFNREVNVAVMHQAVVLYLASQRRGTHATKTRAMVSGGGRKPWRQKGTGRARVGSSRNPVWRGGGVAFGPHPRKYGFKMPRKMRRLALASALSDKMQNENLIVLDEINFKEPKTKEMAKVLENLASENALIVMAEENENVKKSARNIQGIETIKVQNINTYNVLNHNKLILTKDALAWLEEVLG